MNEQLQKWREQIGLTQALDLPALSEADEVAALALLLVHKGFNNKVWSKNLARYWVSFEEKIQLHLAEPDFASFISQFAADLQNTIGRNERQRKMAAELVYCAIAEAALERVRTNTKMLLVLVRIYKDAIKAEYDNYEELEEQIEIS